MNYLHEVFPWWALKGQFLNFRSPIAGKLISNTLSDWRSIGAHHLSEAAIFPGTLEFDGRFCRTEFFNSVLDSIYQL